MKAKVMTSIQELQPWVGSIMLGCYRVIFFYRFSKAAAAKSISSQTISPCSFPLVLSPDPHVEVLHTFCLSQETTDASGGSFH